MQMSYFIGATQFFIYYHSVGPDVMNVLEYYVKIKLVTILEWKLPVESQKDVRTEAQFSALNDCNMRAYVNHFKYAAMVDFDEFIIPRKHANLVDLLGLLA